MNENDPQRNDQSAFAAVRLMAAMGEGRDTVEMPFIIGVMDDLAGNNQHPSALEFRADLSQRKFDKVTGENFADKMAALSPGLEYSVESTLPNAPDKNLKVKLNFNRMEDFGAMQVARHVADGAPHLALLLRLRKQLIALRAGEADPESREKLKEMLLEVAIPIKREL